jgi:hypothetical protein
MVLNIFGLLFLVSITTGQLLVSKSYPKHPMVVGQQFAVAYHFFNDGDV